jgi:hypothetical protein
MEYKVCYEFPLTALTACAGVNKVVQAQHSHLDVSSLAGVLEALGTTAGAAVCGVASSAAAAVEPWDGLLWQWWWGHCPRRCWGLGGSGDPQYWRGLGAKLRFGGGNAGLWHLVHHTPEGGQVAADVPCKAAADDMCGSGCAHHNATVAVAAGSKVHGDGHCARFIAARHCLLHCRLGQQPGHAAVQGWQCHVACFCGVGKGVEASWAGGGCTAGIAFVIVWPQVYCVAVVANHAEEAVAIHADCHHHIPIRLSEDGDGAILDTRLVKGAGAWCQAVGDRAA